MSYEIFAWEFEAGDMLTDLRMRSIHHAGGKNALQEYCSCVHDRPTDGASAFTQEVEEHRRLLGKLGLLRPKLPLTSSLPPYSAFLRFDFMLAKPYISKDDDPFYVAEGVNPVRKCPVFGVPMVSAASWKGLLRWAAMKGDLETAGSEDEFIRRRVRHTRVFGTEKGFETETAWERFLDHRCSTNMAHYRACTAERLCSEAATRHAAYETELRKGLGLSKRDAVPHLQGRVSLYPTFFDKIDIEVINPHPRGTKAGTRPIYLECAPWGSVGTFSLLYVPYDLIGGDEGIALAERERDLGLVARAIGQMMLTYGFSAKRTSGYGIACDKVADYGEVAGQGHLRIWQSEGSGLKDQATFGKISELEAAVKGACHG